MVLGSQVASANDAGVVQLMATEKSSARPEAIDQLSRDHLGTVGVGIIPSGCPKPATVSPLRARDRPRVKR